MKASSKRKLASPDDATPSNNEVDKDDAVNEEVAKQEVKAYSANEMRLWSDRSGKHKINAVFSSRTKTEVTLLTKEFKKVKVKIANLSKEDQKFLSELPEGSENPFTK